jgi:hypothetical protein
VHICAAGLQASAGEIEGELTQIERDIADMLAEVTE